MRDLHVRRVAATIAGAVVTAGLAVGLGGPAPAGADPVAVPDPLTATVVDLPAVPAGLVPAGVALDGDWAYAGLAPTDPTVRPVLHRTAADGTGTWQPVIDPVTSEPLRYVAKRLTVERGVILAGLPATCSFRLITGPATARTIDSCTPSLDAVGSAVLVDDPDKLGNWRVEALDGTVVDAARSYAGPVTLAGGVLTWRDGYDPVIRRRAVGSAEAPASQRLPSSCRWSNEIAARGPFVLAGCAPVTALLRADATVPAYPLRGTGWQLGAGFAVRAAFVAADEPRRIEVADLGSGHRTLDLPEGGTTLLGPDRSGEPAFVLVSATSTVRVVRLSALRAPTTGADDVAPPVVEELSRPAALATGGTFSWRVSDLGMEFPLSTQVRARFWSHGAAMPEWWTSSFVEESTRTVSMPSPSSGDDHLCAEIRARDWAGNTTEWTGGCSRIDSVAPRADLPYSVIENGLLHPGTAAQAVRVSWTGRDNMGIASYDLDYRMVPLGRPLGPWVSPPEWNALRSTTATRVFPRGSAVCFRVRARDLAGNVSDGAPTGLDEYCRYVPLDDRELTRVGRAKRVRSAKAYGGSATELRRAGDALSIRGFPSGHLLVRVLGPRERYSCLRATIGKVRLTCSETWIGKQRFYALSAKRPVRGTLRISRAPGDGRPLVIDAVYVVTSFGVGFTPL